MSYTPIMHCGAVANREQDNNYQNRWFLIDTNKQSIPSDTPKLSDIQVEIKFGYLAIRAPEMLRLDIAMDVIEDDEGAFEQVMCEGQECRAVSEGDLAAQWFSVYLGQEIRLMKKV
ncbi:MOSC N-terminal beta barrel domain-containing protein [Pelistega suis]|uniref:Molybdenum cofactor sulfurase middle domain-containing protein n=1 Tax=Pelistega suis TaxID=1631957 RepID=A0A849P848_9BURK|nr:MOSC N-terminal beta barrel domain-containing protein [Pelistega suis]NOL51942.1 hypothetical protein [Pelistega suis]